MNDNIYITIAVIVLVTAMTRFLPFILFGGKVKTPKIIEKLGRLLPLAIMGMLVVYCLKGTYFTSLEGWLPALVSVCAVVGVHLWKRNTLVSIVAGTACYMLLVQMVF